MPARRRHVGYEIDDDFVIATSNGPWRGSTISQRSNHESEGRDLTGNEKQQPDTVPPTMTSRDRTNEFVNAIRTMQSRTVARAAVSQNPRRARQLQSYSNFMMIAKSIGKNIASTYNKLEKLALRKNAVNNIPLSYSAQRINNASCGETGIRSQRKCLDTNRTTRWNYYVFRSRKLM